MQIKIMLPKKGLFHFLKRLKKIKIMWLGFILVLLLTGCFKKQEEAVVVGVIAPLTGEQAAFGNSCLTAIQMAADEINQQGGILGKQLQLLIADDRGDVLEGVNAFHEMSASNVCAIIGGITSSVAVGLVPLANDTQTILLSPSATADTVDVKQDFVFRTCFTDSFQGAAAARYIKNTENPSVCVLYAAGDAYSCGLKDAFCAECERLNIPVLKVTTAASAYETDYRAQLLRLISENPTHIYAPLYYGAVGPYVLPQAKSMGFSGFFLGGDAYDGLPQYVQDPALLQGVIFTNHYFKNSNDPTIQNFYNAFVHYTNGTPPGSFAALGYDSLYRLKQAIEYAKTDKPQTLKEVLTKLPFSGVTGSFSVDITGTPKKDAVCIAYIDGQEQQVSVIAHE